MSYDELDNEESIKGLDIAEEDFFSSRLPKGYLSISQVTQYLRCGEQYKRRYVDNDISPTSTFSIQGRGVHKAAEALHNSMIAGTPISSDEMISVYSDLHDREIVDAIIIEEEEEPGQIKDAGINLTTHYRKGALGELNNLDTGKRIDAVKPIAAERTFRVVLRPPDSPSVPFVGVIDLEEETSLADLKTKRKAASQLEADNSLQLTVYAYVTGKAVTRLDQLVKPTKTKPARYLRTEALKTRPETLHMLQIVSEVAEDIGSGRFRKTSPENWWCSAKCCSYWDSCRGKKV